ncbi:MAG: hypothetical protein R6U02_05415 [Alkalibacterium sp.]|uniref:hypothetical protein n=1 Tax=Alkalibacterium sp. TaxID=1872447 RepID=UPI003970F986
MKSITYGLLIMFIGIVLIFSGSPGDSLGVLLFIGGTILSIQGRRDNNGNNDSRP